MLVKVTLVVELFIPKVKRKKKKKRKEQFQEKQTYIAIASYNEMLK